MATITQKGGTEMDREKVIKGLELHGNYLADCNGCPYEDKDSPGAECCGKLCADAISLLKEQEAVVRCKDCKFQINRGRKYPECDKHFLWAKDDWFCADGERREGEVK